LKSRYDEVNQLLIKSVDKFIDDGEWVDQPSWWGRDAKSSDFTIQHDYFLLESLLAFGYGGIEDTILDFIAQQGIKDNSKEMPTRGAIQRRANQLTRTLDTLDRTQRAVSEISEKIELKSSPFTKLPDPLCSNKTSSIVENDVSQYQVTKGEIQVETQVETTRVRIPNEVDTTQNTTDGSGGRVPMLITKVSNLERIDSKDVRMAVENIESIIDADIKKTSVSTPAIKPRLITLDDNVQYSSNTVDLTGED